jgi:hypothetical protein
MAAGTLNLTIDQGTTWNCVLTWKINGTAVNLTGYSARLQARQHFSSGTTVLALTSTPADGITLGGVAGTITLSLTATQTAALPALLCVYDLELVSPSGEVTRLVEGTLTVTAEVTR